MRKLLLGLVATAAIASPIALATSADASVTVDETGTGFVGKGDVQTALSLKNDAAIQDLFKADDIKFTMGTERSLSTETPWKCGTSATNWTRTSRTSTVHYAAGTVNATANTNPNGKLADGWNVNGVTGGAYLGGEYTGAPYVAWCPAGTSFKGFLPHVFSETGSTTGLYVNDVALPNTQVDVPVS